MLGVPGLIFQVIGMTIEGTLGQLASLAGTILLIVGLGFYARGKGYHPALGLLGFLSIIGLLILGFIEDKRP